MKCELVCEKFGVGATVFDSIDQNSLVNVELKCYVSICWEFLSLSIRFATGTIIIFPLVTGMC